MYERFAYEMMKFSDSLFLFYVEDKIKNFGFYCSPDFIRNLKKISLSYEESII